MTSSTANFPPTRAREKSRAPAQPQIVCLKMRPTIFMAFFMISCPK